MLNALSRLLKPLFQHKQPTLVTPINRFALAYIVCFAFTTKLHDLIHVLSVSIVALPVIAVNIYLLVKKPDLLAPNAETAKSSRRSRRARNAKAKSKARPHSKRLVTLCTLICLLDASIRLLRSTLERGPVVCHR